MGLISKSSFLISTAVLLIALLLSNAFLSRPDVIIVDKGLDKFPDSFGNYTSEDITMQVGVVRELDTDVFIYRNYIDNDEIINVYIGYYGTKKGGRTGHNPNACYPSSGFAIFNEKQVQIPVKFADARRTQVTVTRLLIAKNDEQQIVYHWYQSAANKILSSGTERNIHRFTSLLRHNRNDGAFVRLSTTVQGDVVTTDDKLVKFSMRIIPLIEQYWPVEKEENVQ